MSRHIAQAGMAVFLLGLFGGCGEQTICIDAVKNFTLHRVSYDEQGQTLWVAGAQNVSGCYADTAESHAVLSFSLDTAGNLSSQQFLRPRHIDEVTPPTPRGELYNGAFASLCTSCRLEIPFAENRYHLRFESAGDLLGDPMTMTLFDDETEIARFALRPGEVVKIVP